MTTPAELTLPLSWSDEGQEGQQTILSLLSNCPGLVKAIHALPEEFLTCGELALEKKIRSHDPDGLFPRMLGLVKILFWEDYVNALRDGRKMVQQYWVHGVCSRIWFHKHVIHNQENLAWLMSAPTEELVLQKELVALSIKKLREVVESDIYTYKSIKDEEGGYQIVKSVNVPLIKEIHSILQTMQNRIHGSVVQRQQIESRNKSIVVTQNRDAVSLSSPNLTMDQLDALDKKIKSIKKSMNTVVAELPATVEVETDAAETAEE